MDSKQLKYFISKIKMQDTGGKLKENQKPPRGGIGESRSNSMILPDHDKPIIAKDISHVKIDDVNNFWAGAEGNCTLEILRDQGGLELLRPQQDNGINNG